MSKYPINPSQYVEQVEKLIGPLTESTRIMCVHLAEIENHAYFAGYEAGRKETARA